MADLGPGTMPRGKYPESPAPAGSHALISRTPTPGGMLHANLGLPQPPPRNFQPPLPRFPSRLSPRRMSGMTMFWGDCGGRCWVSLRVVAGASGFPARWRGRFRIFSVTAGAAPENSGMTIGGGRWEVAGRGAGIKKIIVIPEFSAWLTLVLEQCRAENIRNLPRQRAPTPLFPERRPREACSMPISGCHDLPLATFNLPSRVFRHGWRRAGKFRNDDRGGAMGGCWAGRWN